MPLQLFRRRLACSAPLPSLLCPIPDPDRIASLGVRFTDRNVRHFPQPFDPAALARYQPSALVGTLAHLQDLAPLPTLSALVVLSPPGTCLRPLDRGRLWHTFGVPVFEQRIDADHRLLAFECEAHDGLHTLAVSAPHNADTEPCPCGHPAPRIETERVTAGHAERSRPLRYPPPL